MGSKGESRAERAARRAQARADRAAGLPPRRRGETRLMSEELALAPVHPVSKYAPETVNRALVLRAQGLPLESIARALRIPATTVALWCRRPGNAAVIEDMRARVRQATVAGAEQITPRVLNEANRALDGIRACDLDVATLPEIFKRTQQLEQLSRIAWNLERMSANAAGENRDQRAADSGERTVRIILPDWWRGAPEIVDVEVAPAHALSAGDSACAPSPVAP